MSKRNTMSSTETFSIQGGRGGFAVNRYPLQKGRGLSGLFASLVRKIAPFGKSFLRTDLRTFTDVFCLKTNDYYSRFSI